MEQIYVFFHLFVLDAFHQKAVTRLQSVRAHPAREVQGMSSQHWWTSSPTSWPPWRLLMQTRATPAPDTSRLPPPPPTTSLTSPTPPSTRCRREITRRSGALIRRLTAMDSCMLRTATGRQWLRRWCTGKPSGNGKERGNGKGKGTGIIFTHQGNRGSHYIPREPIPHTLWSQPRTDIPSPTPAPPSPAGDPSLTDPLPSQASPLRAPLPLSSTTQPWSPSRQRRHRFSAKSMAPWPQAQAPSLRAPRSTFPAQRHLQSKQTLSFRPKHIVILIGKKSCSLHLFLCSSNHPRCFLLFF